MNNSGNFKIKRLGRRQFAFGSTSLIVGCLVLGLIGGIIGGYLFNVINKADLSKVRNVNSDGEVSSEEVVMKVSDAVVDVAINLNLQQPGKGQYMTSNEGSGVIYSSDGYIITNNHVINNAKEIVVTLKNGKSYTAKLVGADKDHDLALLKIDTAGLSPVEFADYSEVKLGERTIVIGNPLGEYSGSVTDGVVSSLNRKVDIDGKTMTLLQTCAEINAGNSGGGVFNSSGKLIGVVVAKARGDAIEGLGFAIPSNVVLNFVKKYCK